MINTFLPHGGLVTLTQAESQTGHRVLDADGREVISQRLSTGDLAFPSSDVPAFGSRHFRVVAGSCSLTNRRRSTETLLDNGMLQVELDRATGNIVGLREKATGRDFADASVNGGLNAFRWLPAKETGDARSDTVCSISLKESGPLLAEVEIVSQAPAAALSHARYGWSTASLILRSPTSWTSFHCWRKTGFTSDLASMSPAGKRG